MEKSNNNNTKIRDNERERERERKRERESKKKNRQGRRHQDNLTKHGMAHTPLNQKLLSTHTNTHTLCQRGARLRLKKSTYKWGRGGEFASETGLHLHSTLTHGNSSDGRKGIAM